ncbi:6626_t:CDS:2 [Funneliformis geosporum]|uniref:6626_t:CDS:1 n=1 Tax=Funneliformis geosporum TaxID=1117311 RepID=A0A9W4WXY3_9GLOM|nr:6626_t:CDS:2 [Funneliformis geosporum]
MNRPTIAGINGIINGNINGGIFTGISERTTLKRDREKVQMRGLRCSHKQTKIDDENAQWPCIQAHIPPLRVVSPSNSYLYSTQQELINHISKCFTSSIPAVGAKRNEPSDNNEEQVEGDEEIKVDLTSITEHVQRAPTNEWKVGDINVTQRFRHYQEEVLIKAENEGLTYENIYEVLALSSMMVLCSPCPYHVFTNQEWKEITKTNPYSAKEPLLPPEIASSLRDTAGRHFICGDVFMDRGESELNKLVSIMFNNLYYGIPDVAPLKLSEEEHCDMFVYPISRSFHRSGKEYDLVLNRATRGKDTMKAQLKARKSINQQLETKGGPGISAVFLNMGDLMESSIVDLQYDGLYRSWPFLTTKLVIDKATIPLAEFAISHLVALEERVENIARDFKCQNYRNNKSTQPAKISFMRNLPDSPQINMLLN